MYKNSFDPRSHYMSSRRSEMYIEYDYRHANAATEIKFTQQIIPESPAQY